MNEALDIAPLAFGPDGTPVSAVYGDVYHSTAGGPAQARYVFLGGNGLPARWRGRARFGVVETGFGLGLNFLATWRAWRDDAAACDVLDYVAFEKHPFCAEDLAVAQAAWPEFADLAAELRALWPALTPGEHLLRLAGGRLRLRLVFGDVRTMAPGVTVSADAFYLDGFSPAKNPDMWSPDVCAQLARLGAPGATLATWSVAGSVRRAVQSAGFSVEKRLGFAGKRQMLVGVLA